MSFRIDRQLCVCKLTSNLCMIVYLKGLFIPLHRRETMVIRLSFGTFSYDSVPSFSDWLQKFAYVTIKFAKQYCVKPGSHLRHDDITGRSRKRKKCLVLMFYVSSVNNISQRHSRNITTWTYRHIRIKLIFSLCRYGHVVYRYVASVNQALQDNLTKQLQRLTMNISRSDNWHTRNKNSD